MSSKNTASTLLACAGSLMLLSGILMAVCISLPAGGMLWAAASCMFFAAYHFKQSENHKQKEQEDSDHE